MVGFNKNVYLETSAVNYLADKYRPHDGKATKIYHSVRGSRFYISTVTIWEILLTSNDLRREILIHYLQNVGHHQLLSSPAEFIINYIKAGCPPTEPRYDFHSRQPLAKVWEDVASNPLKTFIFEKKQMTEASKMVREGFRLATELTKNAGITEIIVDPVTNSRLAIEDLLKQLKGIGFPDLSDLDKRHFKLSIVIMAMVLCYEPGIEDPAVDEFWNGKGVHSTPDKLAYLIAYHESLIYEGPVSVMARMALLQLGKNGKWTRGIYWDVLHSVYLIYTDLFYTSDNHFKMLRDSEDHLIYKRIIFLPDAGLFTAKHIDLI